MNSKKWLSYPYILWMAAFIIIPLLMIIYYGFTAQDGSFTISNLTLISDPINRKALWLSLKLSIISTLLCLVLAYPVALILHNMKLKSNSFIVMIFILPMWMNFLLRTLAWQNILEKTGVINTFLNLLHLPNVNIINTPAAIIFGMVYNFLPFMILPLFTTLTKMDESLLEAAYDLGAGRATAFAKVILPLSAPGIVSGVTMVFLPAMTNYVILDMLYNSTYIMGSLIGSYFSAYDWNSGSMISIILLLIIFLLTWATNGFREDDNRRGALL